MHFFYLQNPCSEEHACSIRRLFYIISLEMHTTGIRLSHVGIKNRGSFCRHGTFIKIPLKYPKKLCSDALIFFQMDFPFKVFEIFFEFVAFDLNE